MVTNFGECFKISRKTPQSPPPNKQIFLTREFQDSNELLIILLMVESLWMFMQLLCLKHDWGAL